MTLEEACKRIQACTARMNTLYKRTLFDEWAIVSLLPKQTGVLAYLGPRKDDFQKNFDRDIGTLRGELFSDKHDFGDFAFSREGVGTHFEAFMVLGEGLFLICNNTVATMDTLAKEPLWLGAQVPFAELSDRFRSDPLVYPL